FSRTRSPGFPVALEPPRRAPASRTPTRAGAGGDEEDEEQGLSSCSTRVEGIPWTPPPIQRARAAAPGTTRICGITSCCSAQPLATAPTTLPTKVARTTQAPRTRWTRRRWGAGSVVITEE